MLCSSIGCSLYTVGLVLRRSCKRGLAVASSCCGSLSFGIDFIYPIRKASLVQGISIIVVCSCSSQGINGELLPSIHHTEVVLKLSFSCTGLSRLCVDVLSLIMMSHSNVLLLWSTRHMTINGSFVLQDQIDSLCRVNSSCFSKGFLLFTCLSSSFSSLIIGSLRIICGFCSSDQVSNCLDMAISVSLVLASSLQVIANFSHGDLKLIILTISNH